VIGPPKLTRRWCRTPSTMASLSELVEQLDLADPAFIADPYPLLGALREATPIFFYPRTGQWTLTRFAPVHELLRDRRAGRAYTQRYTHAEFGRPAPDPRWQAFRDHDRWSLLELEPPDHTRIRRLVSAVFTPRAVAALRPEIEARAARLMDACRERGRFELLREYAQPYSVGVICSMLGVPEADAALLLDWSHAIVQMYELTATDDMKAGATRAASEFMDYTRGVIADKRAHPDPKLISALVAVEDSGERLSEDEIVSTIIVLLNAGHEATVNTLGNGTRALMHHRDEWRRLVAGEVDPRVAVEELLRWDPPLQLFERWILEDGVELAGQPVPCGSEVAMLFGAANRDPRRFDDPDRFDVGRGDTAHIGFGGGIHFCIGAPLARLELEVSVATLIATLPGLELVTEPAYHPAFVIRGLTGVELSIG
jgi:cytochrome P450